MPRSSDAAGPFDGLLISEREKSTGAAANFPKLCHGSLEHVLPQKNLEKMLVGGPITKPMDLAITLCPFGPQRIALVCCGSVL